MSGAAFGRLIKVGPELTFTNNLMIEQTKHPTQPTTEEGRKNIRQWYRLMLKECESGGCRVEKTEIKGNLAFKVSFADGWWFEVSQDPCVLEVTWKHEYIAETAARSEVINKYIFQMAKQIGLETHDRTGGGHVNLDRATGFGGNDLLFRNFLVHRASHPELAWGIFGNHLGNSPPILALKSESLIAFGNAIRDFDFYGHDSDWLAEQINLKVYTNHPADDSQFIRRRHFLSRRPDPADLQHYQDIGLESFSAPTPIDQQRIDLRGFRPQDSLATYLDEAEFLQLELTYLEGLRRPIPIEWPRTHNMQPGEKLRRFQELTAQMGGDVERFTRLVWPQTLNAAPQRDFPTAQREELRLPEVYGAVMGIHNGLNSRDTQGLAAYSRETGSDGRGLNMVPKFIPAEEKDFILRGSRQRARGMHELRIDFLSQQPRAVQSGIIPAELFESVRAANASNLSSEFNFAPRFGHVYAPDIVRAEDGNYYVIEDNVGNAGGQGDSSQSRMDLLAMVPEYRQIFSAQSTTHFAGAITQYLKGLGASDERPAFLFSRSEHDSYRKYFGQFQQAGAVVDFIEDKRVGYQQDGRLHYHFESATETTDHLIGGIFLRGVSLTWFRQNYPRTTAAVLRGDLPLIATAEVTFTDKRILPYMDALTEFYTGEPPILKTAKSWNLARPDGSLDTEVYERVWSQPVRYVVKHRDGRQGKQVWIGGQIDDQALRQHAKKHPTEYMVQERLAISVLRTSITDIRTFQVIMNNGDIVQGEDLWARSLAVWAGGHLNVSQSAGVAAVFSTSEVRNYSDLKELQAATSAADILSRVELNPELADAMITQFLNLNPTLDQLAAFTRFIQTAPSLSLIVHSVNGGTALSQTDFERFYRIWQEAHGRVAQYEKDHPRIAPEAEWKPPRLGWLARVGQGIKNLFVSAPKPVPFATPGLEARMSRWLIGISSSVNLSRAQIKPQDFSENGAAQFTVARMVISSADRAEDLLPLVELWNQGRTSAEQRELWSLARKRIRELKSSFSEARGFLQAHPGLSPGLMLTSAQVLANSCFRLLSTPNSVEP